VQPKSGGSGDCHVANHPGYDQDATEEAVCQGQARTSLSLLCALRQDQDVEEPLKVVRHVLERLDLSLNEAKTHIVDATQVSFNFLGFAIRISRGIRTGKPYPHVCPATKSLKKIKTKLTAMTGRELTPIPLEAMVGNVNRSLRGWVNYFHYRNSNQVMEKFKIHAEQRMRKHLMKRHKVKTGGSAKIDSRVWICTGVTGYTKFQQQRVGSQRMPRREEHRKAVCGRTACTV
jgi:hypothetical protein